MKTLEFQTVISADSTIEVPADIAQQLDEHQPVRVILLAEDDNDADWQQLTAAQFLKGYAANDDIYDNL